MYSSPIFKDSLFSGRPGYPWEKDTFRISGCRSSSALMLLRLRRNEPERGWGKVMTFLALKPRSLFRVKRIWLVMVSVPIISIIDTANWKTIRALRKNLRELTVKRSITKPTYRKLFNMSKGGAFRNTEHLKEYIEAHKLLRRK